MKKNRYKIKKDKIIYAEKKPLFADKEIIFRSNGRARVFNISHRLQVITLILMTALFCWSGYNYYFYHHSAKIIHRKDKELGKTRNAYMDLMADVAALQNNLKDVMSSIEDADQGLNEISDYKEKASAVEDKIKKMADFEAWIDPRKVEDKVSKKEAIIQKDIALQENDVLRHKIENLGYKLHVLQETVHGLEQAEIVILDKIGKLSGKEIEEIKGALSQINKSLKVQKLYFNPLSNIKAGQGGAYIPLPDARISPQLNNKISEVFKRIDLLENYKLSMTKVPLGKPVFNARLTSNFGNRSDPINTKLTKHKGIDMSAAVGTRVSVSAPGKVLSASFQNNGYGNLVEIDHGNGFTTKYAHLNKIYVKEGDWVQYNQAIGEVGKTGRATGSHLHYEVLYHNKNVNPLTFVNIDNKNEI